MVLDLGIGLGMGWLGVGIWLGWGAACMAFEDLVLRFCFP
jgi:hypothetical protein